MRCFQAHFFALKISFLGNTILRNSRSAYSTNETKNKHTPEERFTFDKLVKLVAGLKKKLCQPNTGTCSHGPSGSPGPLEPRGERGERGRRENKGKSGNRGDHGIMGPPRWPGACTRWPRILKLRAKVDRSCIFSNSFYINSITCNNCACKHGIN